MRDELVDQVAVDCIRIGCPEWFVREWLAELGRPMTLTAWRRYYLAAVRMAQDAPSGLPR